MAWTAVQDSVAENKTKLDETMRIEAKKIGQIYDQRRLELQAKRFENESAKKAANFQLLQQSMAESQNLKSMRDQAAIQLDAWKNQMQESIKMGLVKLQSQTEVAPSVRPETFQPTYGKTQQQNVPQAYRTTVPVGDDISGLTGNQDEWLKGVLNPFGV
ncbi:MAG: hypothetical protein ACD_50C00110G0001 [uncultured bacterium]|nr:MAG: hypothetical protein ACD_50C00110G0001 [uncultured bacterium]